MFKRGTANFVLILAIGAGFFLLGNAHAALAQTTDVGYRDFNYGTGINEPTADKPQSKLWFNDGIWWGSLWNPSVRRWEIHRFDWNTNTWTSAGTTIDGRGNVRPDVLWDGTHLYVVTAPNTSGSTDQRALVRRYSYNGTNKSYTLDANFPVAVANGPMETIVLDKDTTGKLWVTFTQGSKVYVNCSLDSDSSWGTSFIPPALSGTTVNPDDISSVISFDRQNGPPQIGLMWSNQNDNAVFFATHRDGDPDGVWQPTQMALGGPKYADDHISLRSLEADSSGRVFAAVKTSLNDTTTPNPDDPLIHLLVLSQQNQWNKHTFGRVRDNHTKPMVTIDQVNRKLYVFATGPTGTIYYKQSDLDNISFLVGLGTPFIKSTNSISNVTSTKQNITQASGIGATGMLVLASDNVNRYYWHNTFQTAAPPPSDTTAPETGSTFQCSLDGAAFASCASPKDYTGLSEGSHTFEVKATDAAGNTDTTPASRSWTFNGTAPRLHRGLHCLQTGRFRSPRGADLVGHGYRRHYRLRAPTKHQRRRLRRRGATFCHSDKRYRSADTGQRLPVPGARQGPVRQLERLAGRPRLQCRRLSGVRQCYRVHRYMVHAELQQRLRWLAEVHKRHKEPASEVHLFWWGGRLGNPEGYRPGHG